MGGFGRNDDKSGAVPTEQKAGKVTAMKASPEKGKRRYTVREKSASRKIFTVDIPYSEAKDIERKETYNFDVYEAEERKSYGGVRSSSRMKSYLCDEAPEVFTSARKSQFTSFDSGKGSLSNRTKF
jgi:hypothetical protein